MKHDPIIFQADLLKCFRAMSQAMSLNLTAIRNFCRKLLTKTRYDINRK